MRKTVIGIIGGRKCTEEVEQLTQKLGENLSEVAQTIVCGGLGGTMRAVCQGFKRKGGVTIGIIPGYSKEDANPDVDIVIPTGMGLARNVLVVSTSDAVVALPGEAGTLSEIAYCLQFKIPVISLNSWDIPGVIKTATVEETINELRKLIGNTRHG